MQTTFNTQKDEAEGFVRKNEQDMIIKEQLYFGNIFWLTEPWCFRYMLECKDSNPFSVANNILHMVCQRLRLYETKFDCKIQQQRM